MKIAYISKFYPPITGGMERVARFMSENMVSRGHDVDIYTSDRGKENLESEEEINGVRIKRIPTLKLLGNTFLLPLKWPEESEYDIVHSLSHASPFYLSFMGWVKEKKLPLVTHFMALKTMRDHPNKFFSLIGSRYEDMAVSIALKATDKPLTRSRRDQELLKENYNVESLFLPDGIPSRYFEVGDKGNEFRKKYDIQAEYIILFIGRLERLKGPQVLLRSIPYLNEFKKDFTVLFVGPDSGRKKELVREGKNLDISEKFRILGRISEEDKIAAIDASRVLVVPSISDWVEVYPMVISEAWARETPVIGTRIGGIPYRIDDGENGFLVQPDDPGALAGAIREIIENKKVSSKMGKEGKKKVKSWEDIAEQAERSYKKVLATKTQEK